MVALTRHPVAQLRRQGLQRGLLGGNRAWLVVGIGLWLARAARRAFTKSAEVAAIEILKPGEAITIRALAPPSRRD